MFDDLQHINLFPTAASEILLHISVALICALFIAWLYRLTYKGPGYSPSFLKTIVLLSMITAIVIMVIGNNLARAFGLVGAMSIIRFRTAIKETLDIVYIFFGLSVGLAAGVGYHKIAILGTLFTGFVLFIFSKTDMGSPKRREYLLQFSYAPNGNETPQYQPVLNKFCRQHNIMNVRSDENQNLLDVAIYVKLKSEEKSNQFIQELRKKKGIHNINLFFDEQEF